MLFYHVATNRWACATYHDLERHNFSHQKDVVPSKGLLRELNPGPLAPEARIIPLDQAARYPSLLQITICQEDELC